MKRLGLASALLVIAACSSVPEKMTLPPPEGLPAPVVVHPPRAPREPVSEHEPHVGIDLPQLQSKLGMSRGPSDLGYVEKAFDGCSMGVRGDDGKCGSRYFTVVNFRLVCRDTEGTTEQIVTSVRPLVTDQVKWKLAGLNGVTRTDSNGYGSVLAIGARPAKGQRLVLTVGRQFLGLEISTVSQIVLPVYWCTEIARWDFDLHHGDRQLSCQNSSAREVNLSVQ